MKQTNSVSGLPLKVRPKSNALLVTDQPSQLKNCSTRSGLEMHFRGFQKNPMMDKNSETSFTDLELICNVRCFTVVIGLIGVNTGFGNDILVCNVLHEHVTGVS